MHTPRVSMTGEGCQPVISIIVTTLDRRNGGAVDGRLLPVFHCTCIRFVFHIMRLRSLKKTAAPVSNLVIKVDLDSDR